MKKLILLIVTCLLAGMSYAQNPFEKFGYTPKMGTLSKGKYIEHFDQDSIVQIGSVLLNPYTKSIVGFVKQEKVYSEATLKPEIVSRWLNPDPLADEFPDTSPYVFTNNNPIRFTDPEGLAPFDVIINGDLAEKATEQLNASTSLTITRNSETGKLSATGTADTESDVALLEAINDQNVVVDLNASSANISKNPDGSVSGAIFGGSFGGSVKIPGMNLVFANQQVNPNQAEVIEASLGLQTGSVIKHEAIEAYAGAVLHPGSPSTKDAPGNTGYTVAHGVTNNIFPQGDVGVQLSIQSVKPTLTTFGVRQQADGSFRGSLKSSLVKLGREDIIFIENNLKFKKR